VSLNIEDSDPISQVFGSPLLYFGFQYNVGVREAGMYKMGDRRGWGGRTHNILAGDADSISPNSSAAQASHPDPGENVMGSVWVQNQAGFSLGSLRFGVNTYSRWAIAGTYRRGPLDMNYAPDDGSVFRLGGVTWRVVNGEDERLTPVPLWAQNYTFSGVEWWTYIPAR
jgi:hypothetical protein